MIQIWNMTYTIYTCIVSYCMKKKEEYLQPIKLRQTFDRVWFDYCDLIERKITTKHKIASLPHSKVSLGWMSCIYLPEISDQDWCKLKREIRQHPNLTVNKKIWNMTYTIYTCIVSYCMKKKKKNTYNLLSFGRPLTVSDLITVIWLKERSLQNIKYTIVINLTVYEWILHIILTCILRSTAHKGHIFGFS
jgi:hypothetical protein